MFTQQIIYENSIYKIVASFKKDGYLIINKETGVTESKESALPTAKFKAHALVEALNKFHSTYGVTYGTV